MKVAMKVDMLVRHWVGSSAVALDASSAEQKVASKAGKLAASVVTKVGWSGGPMANLKDAKLDTKAVLLAVK